jgi:hypothetical protein
LCKRCHLQSRENVQCSCQATSSEHKCRKYPCLLEAATISPSDRPVAKAHIPG